MRKLFLLLCFTGLQPFVSAQENQLRFDKEYYECENKYVLLPKMEKDTTYMLGVVYLDVMAGFSFNVEGRVDVDKSSKFTLINTLPQSRIIHRIDGDFPKMAIVPDAKVAQMGLPKEPDWLNIYREGENEVEGQVKRGYHFNHIGGSLQAIPILIKAYAKDPHARALNLNLPMLTTQQSSL